MPAYPRSETHLICDSLEPLPPGAPASAVTARLLELFSSGTIPLGSRIPPERELAETLRVGRSAVREAIATLDTLGVVEVRPSAGTFLRSARSEFLPRTLGWSALLGERDIAELVEVRGALEVHAARAVAERCGRETALVLADHLAQMGANVHDLDAFIDADAAFHRELATASGNSMLIDLLGITHSLLHARVPATVDGSGHAHLAIDEHRAVYEAIEAGDGAAAASAMQQHMHTAAGLLVADAAA